jgi:uncharacterized protein
MAAPYFDWDSANIGHIAEHKVTPEEAEQVLLGDPLELGYDPDANGEGRWSYIGETSAGRILRVAVTTRGERLRVVTSFEPSKQNKQSYLAIRAGQYDRSEGS